MADTTIPPADTSGAVPAPPPFPFKPPPPEPAGEIADHGTRREIEWAEMRLANGADRAKVIAELQAAGVDPGLLDDRTPAQKAHDRAHGMPGFVDPASYSFPLGHVPVENAAKLNSDVRELASDMALPHASGNSFCQILVAAVATATQHSDMSAVEAQTQRHGEMIRAAFGEKYEAAAKLVNELLDAAGKGHSNQKLIAELRPGRALCTPNVFGFLYARAGAVKAWADTAPK